MKTPEARVKTTVMRYLERRGIFAWVNATGCVRVAPDRWIRFGKKGSADIIGVLPDGKFLAVECKSRNGKLSPEQKEFIERVRNTGALAVCVRGSRELDETLRANGYGLEDMPLFGSKTDENRGG